MAENIEKLILDDSGFINPLKESIKVMEEAEKAFKDLNNAQAQGGQKAANEIKKASEVQQKAIHDVAKAAKVSIMTQEEHARKITETAAAMLKSGDTAKKFAELLKKVETVKLSGAKSDIQDLEKEFTGLLKTVKLTDDQMDFLSQNIDEVAKEIASLDAKELENIANKAGQMTDKFVTAKSELRQLTNLINSGQLTGDELIMAKNRAGQLTDEIGDTRDEIKRLASDTRGLDLLGDSMQALGATAQIAEGSLALFGDESREMQEALIRLNAVMAISNGLSQLGEQITKKGTLANKVAIGVQAAYAAVVGTSTGAMKLFRIALAATGIGLLIIGLGALVTNFEKVKSKTLELFPSLDKLGNFFGRLDNIAKGAIDGVVAGLGAVGEVVSKLFSGDFSGAYEAAKQVGAKIGKATNEGIAEADKDDANNAQAKVIDNIVKSQKKRLEVLEASGKETAKLQKNILQNELKSLQLAGAEKQVIEDKQHEIALFNAERSKIAAEKAAAAKAKADEIEAQRIEKIKEALQELKGLQDEIFEVQKNTGNLSEKEIFDFVKIKQIEQIELLITKLKEVAAVTGRDVTPEIKKLDDAIRTISFEGFEIKGVEKIGSTLERDIAKYTNQIPAIKVSVPVEPKPEAEINNFDDLLDKILTDILGDIDGGKAKEFLIGAATLVGEFGNILNEATDIQLSNIDKQLDKLSERRENLQDELSRELELQEKGLANNVGNKQAEVDALLSEEDRLLKQRDQIQKEAQKRQLISDTITQTQGLITSAINIYKGFSVLGPFGIPLAIAAIASMFAFFAKTKAEAFKATKLYSGAERISDHFGYGERHGDTDLPGRGSGYRLINERTGKPTNVIISGKEMLLPESVSLPNSEFFHSLRNGVYNGVDLNAAMGFYLNYKGKVHRATQNTVIVAQNAPQTKNKARVAIPHTMKNGRKGVIITTIKDDWTDGKFIEFDL